MSYLNPITDTLVNLNNSNPTPAKGQAIIAIDTVGTSDIKAVIGDGINRWNQLVIAQLDPNNKKTQSITVRHQTGLQDYWTTHANDVIPRNQIIFLTNNDGAGFAYKIGDGTSKVSQLTWNYSLVQTEKDKLDSLQVLNETGDSITQPISQNAATTAINNVAQSVTDLSNAVDTALGSKVDKITGKGLSTNDYTDTAAAKVATIGTPSEGGTVIIQGSVTETSGNTNALNTTSASVNVSNAAPPTTGKVLRATSPIQAEWQTLDKNAVGLNNVDNTSDANKPISTAAQTALSALTSDLAAKQATITLTTTNNSGAATFSNNTLNIPTYTLVGLGGITLNSISATTPLSYNSATGVLSIQQASGSQGGYISSADWNTFNNKQSALNGTGFIKITGTTISYDNSTYLTTVAAALAYGDNVVTLASAASYALDITAYNNFVLSASATAITGFTITGTPPTEHKITVVFAAHTAARTIAWGSPFESSTVTLPTTTVANQRLDVGFTWNSATNKYRIIGAV